MQILPLAPSPSWVARAIALVTRFFRVHPQQPDPPRPWPDMKPIDYEGEDGSLTEKHLRLMK